jgi:RNA polymerase sigma-70 factor, ECF subfamily
MTAGGDIPHRPRLDGQPLGVCGGWASRQRKKNVSHEQTDVKYLRPKFRGKSSERSWLCVILKNKICDYFRKLGRETCFTDLEFLEDELSHKFVSQGFWNHETGPLEWKPEAEVVMHRAEFWETFRDCLAKLPQRVADVFMLREMEEMETPRICEALNISPNNLWVMLHRARMALRECLEMNWFKEPQQEGHL